MKCFQVSNVEGTKLPIKLFGIENGKFSGPNFLIFIFTACLGHTVNRTPFCYLLDLMNGTNKIKTKSDRESRSIGAENAVRPLFKRSNGALCSNRFEQSFGSVRCWPMQCTTEKHHRSVILLELSPPVSLLTGEAIGSFFFFALRSLR